MLVNIWVKDNCTGYVHQVGTDPHDSLELWNGVVQYVNLQCIEGTMGGGFSFVEPPDMDDYVSVTPEQLMVNWEMLHADIVAMIAKNPEIMPHTDKFDEIVEGDGDA